MISIEKLKAVKKVVCHGPGCADGRASAMLLHDALLGVEIVFAQYGKQQEAIEVEPGLLYCDFSPDKGRLQEFIDAGTIVLDHHRWTKEVVEAFGDNGVFGDEKDDPGVSGAVLAFREVWEPLCGHQAQGGMTQRASAFAELAGVYDTWQTQDARWFEGRVQERALRNFSLKELLGRSRPFSDGSVDWWAEKILVGRALIDKLDADVESALRGAYRYNTSEGTRVIIFEGTILTSIAAEVVDKDADLIIGFNYKIEDDNEVLMMLGIRSHTGYDCMKLAAQFGGGGHTAAAGFSTTFLVKDGSHDPYTVVKAFVQQHEGPEVS